MKNHIDINIDNAGFFIVLSENINQEDVSIVMYRKGLVPKEECEKDHCSEECCCDEPKPEDYMITLYVVSKRKNKFYFLPPPEFLTYPSGWYLAYLFYGDQLIREIDVQLNGITYSSYLTNVDRIDNCKEYPAPTNETVFDCCKQPCDLCCQETKPCGCEEIPCGCVSTESYVTVKTVKCKDYTTDCRIEDDNPEPVDVIAATEKLLKSTGSISITESPRENARTLHLQTKVKALKGQLKQQISPEEFEAMKDIYLGQINDLTKQYQLLRNSIEKKSQGERHDTSGKTLGQQLAQKLSGAFK